MITLLKPMNVFFFQFPQKKGHTHDLTYLVVCHEIIAQQHILWNSQKTKWGNYGKCWQRPKSIHVHTCSNIRFNLATNILYGFSILRRGYRNHKRKRKFTKPLWSKTIAHFGHSWIFGNLATFSLMPVKKKLIDSFLFELHHMICDYFVMFSFI